MTELRPQSRSSFVPDPSVLSAAYWQGCQNAELRYQHCGNCGAATHTPASVCSTCHSDALGWATSSGRGVVHSYTVVWRPVSPDFDVPHAPVLVAMEEGWLMLTALVGCDHSEVHIDMEVEVEFHAGADGLVLPYVRPTR